jgi:hypothetical protein
MGNDKGQKGHGDQHLKKPLKTFLYIRTHPADNGTEPLPSEFPCWISPDITIRHPNGIEDGEAIVGQPNHVKVTVTNAGAVSVSNAKVDAFVCVPSTAFTPASTFIGSGYLNIPGSLLPGYNPSAAVEIPWTPLPVDAGHRCLLARVCSAVPPDCYADPNHFNVVGDRHVAQRNIHVVGGNKIIFSFGFRIVNPMDEPSSFIIKATEVKVGKKADMIRIALGSKHAQFAETSLADINLYVGEVIKPPDVSISKRKPNIKMFGVLPDPIPDPGKLKSKTIKMVPEEIRYAVLTVTRNPDDRDGELHVVQVEQIDIQTKRSVGGLWVVA